MAELEYIKKKGAYTLKMYGTWGKIETKSLNGYFGTLTAMRTTVLKIWASITDTINTPAKPYVKNHKGKLVAFVWQKYERIGMI